MAHEAALGGSLGYTRDSAQEALCAVYKLARMSVADSRGDRRLAAQALVRRFVLADATRTVEGRGWGAKLGGKRHVRHYVAMAYAASLAQGQIPSSCVPLLAVLAEVRDADDAEQVAAWLAAFRLFPDKDVRYPSTVRRVDTECLESRVVRRLEGRAPVVAPADLSAAARRLLAALTREAAA